MTEETSTFDFAVIGAGIAGASVAAELAREAGVILLEAEAQPGYHTTGRSAAMFAPGYGPQPIRALTRAATAFFSAPPDGFCASPLLSPRDVLMIARADQMDILNGFCGELAGEVAQERLDADQLVRRCPLLRPGYAAAGVLDSSGSDIDVGALLQGYLGAYRKAGGVLKTGSAVQALRRTGDIWHLLTAAGPIRAHRIINAAGAWAEQIGQMAGAESIGLIPKRRTAMLIEAPETLDLADLALVGDIEEAFYLKPDAGRLLISPANEDPMPPCDAQPEELDVALCVDRIERAFDLRITRIAHKWAGLRSFVPDKCPVVGFSDAAPGFFWLAGQGGYGIQTSPALSRYAAARALNREPPADILEQGLAPDSLAPGRLMP